MHKGRAGTHRGDHGTDCAGDRLRWAHRRDQLGPSDQTTGEVCARVTRPREHHGHDDHERASRIAHGVPEVAQRIDVAERAAGVERAEDGRSRSAEWLTADTARPDRERQHEQRHQCPDHERHGEHAELLCMYGERNQRRQHDADHTHRRRATFTGDAIVLPRGNARERTGERGEWCATEPNDAERNRRSNDGDYDTPSEFVHARGEKSAYTRIRY